MTDRAYGNIEEAPREHLSHTGRRLNGYRVEAIIYAPDLKEAQARLNGADIYLDHAKIVKWEHQEPALDWKLAGHKQEPRDQKADQSVFEHGYWDLGPAADDSEWTVTLVHQDEDGDVIHEWTWPGRDEKRVKDIAHFIENGVRELKAINSGRAAGAVSLLIREWISGTIWMPR